MSVKGMIVNILLIAVAGYVYYLSRRWEAFLILFFLFGGYTKHVSKNGEKKDENREE